MTDTVPASPLIAFLWHNAVVLPVDGGCQSKVPQLVHFDWVLFDSVYVVWLDIHVSQASRVHVLQRGCHLQSLHHRGMLQLLQAGCLVDSSNTFQQLHLPAPLKLGGSQASLSSHHQLSQQAYMYSVSM